MLSTGFKSITCLCKLQQSRYFLLQVLTRREKLMTEQQAIRDCKAKVNAAKQRGEAVRKRSRGMNASSKAARDLMTKQTSSVSTACSKLEVHPRLYPPPSMLEGKVLR